MGATKDWLLGEDIKCNFCGFVAFRVSPEKALETVCVNCGRIIEKEIIPEESGEQINPTGSGPSWKEKSRLLFGLFLRYASKNYTRGVLTVIAIAMCVIAYKLCVPSSPFVTWGELANSADDSKKKNIPVIRIQGGTIRTDTDVSGTIGIDR